MPSQARPQDQNLSNAGHVIRFDRYEVDVRSGELRKEGRKVRLQAQPFQLLVLLLKSAGRVVSRDEVRQELWPGDTFVDFDHGLAAAVNKIRDALCDSADKPKYVETLPKRGYRFIGKVEQEPPVEIRAKLEGVPPPNTTVEARPTEESTDARQRHRSWAIGAVLLLLGAGIGFAVVLLLGQKSPEPPAQEWKASQFTSYPGVTNAPAFSPDGSRIAFGFSVSSDGRYALLPQWGDYHQDIMLAEPKR